MLTQLLILTILLLPSLTLLIYHLRHHHRPRTARKTAVVLVLGDVGRSPRMMYHAQSLVREGYGVTLVGYEGTSLNAFNLSSVFELMGRRNTAFGIPRTVKGRQDPIHPASTALHPIPPLIHHQRPPQSPLPTLLPLPHTPRPARKSCGIHPGPESTFDSDVIRREGRCVCSRDETRGGLA
jgi:hypothetical protein